MQPVFPVAGQGITMLASSIRVTLLATTAALTGLVALPAHAQEPFDLGQIIVSGGLTPIDAATYGRAVDVITAQDIADRGIATVQDALRVVPGVSVNSSGASLTQIRIRGAEGNHTLVLIDGIEAAGGDSEYFFGGLQTANIERIEVLRGPQSVFYGSNASAGVINIITRKGVMGRTASASLELGAATTASAFFSNRTDRGGLSLALSGTDDTGYDISGDGGEKDGSRRKAAVLSGDFMVTDDLKLGFTLRRADERYAYDRASSAATDEASYIVDTPDLIGKTVEANAQVFAEYSMMAGRLDHRLAVQTTRNKLTNTDAPTTKTTTDAIKYRLTYGIDGTIPDADQLVNLLVERQKDTNKINADFNRQSTSVALEYRGRFNSGVSVQAGLRYDKNDVFDNATTWNLGLAYTLPQNGIRLHASAGTGVVNPTYIELYGGFGTIGSPDLQPERNRSFDLGASFPVLGDRGSIDVTYFNETLTNEITYVFGGAGANYFNQTGKSKRKGVEVSGTLQATDTLALRMGYTYLEAKNPDGSIETRRPRTELTMGMTLDTFSGRGSVSADLRHVAGNLDTQSWGSSATREMPNYTTVDVAARYDLTQAVSLTGRVTNLFDKETSDTWGYANRGRAIYVGLNARF
jgi:vitamin B12 transporter